MCYMLPVGIINDDDVEYADDLALLTHSPAQMQVKTKYLEEDAMSDYESIKTRPKY